MAGVYCPTCEAGVEAGAKFCLACGHDLTGQGPITATGHDLNQIKEVIRHRDDLSMAEKFDMIAKVEEGANPILLPLGLRLKKRFCSPITNGANHLQQTLLSGLSYVAPMVGI